MNPLTYDDPVQNAFNAFINAGFDYGQVIDTKWFMNQFRIDPAKTPEQHERNKMVYVRYLGELRSLLLKRKQMALRSKPGIGQEIVIPQDQTSWAMKELKDKIYLEMGRAKDRLLNVEFSQLSDEDRRENSDAVAKLSFLAKRNVKALDF